MWRTSSLTCRGVFLAVLCGSAIPAGAGILGFQAVEPHNSSGTVTEQLSLDATEAVGYVSFTFPNDLAPELIVPRILANSLTHAYLDDRAALLGSLAAMLRGPGASLTPLVAPAHLPGGHDSLPEFNTDFPAGAALGHGGVFDRAVNPAEYFQMGFSPESSFDDLLPALQTGMGDPVAAAHTLSGGVHGRPLVGAAERQTSDEFIRRAPVPGALFLAVFGLGVAGLSWRRFV